MTRNDPLFNKALNVCRSHIGDKSVVSFSEINEAIELIKGLPTTYKDVDLEMLTNELLGLYSVRIENSRILEGKNASKPWLKEFKAKNASEWKFWKRYVEYMKKKICPAVISQLDETTEKMLDNLFNPNLPDIRIAKKGLVVGKVQSGKTANYIGLICKAADAGFNLIVVLAGMYNNLRSQTQNRIDEGFLGFDTKGEIGSGLISGYENLVAHSYTFNDDQKKGGGILQRNPQEVLISIRQNPLFLL